MISIDFKHKVYNKCLEVVEDKITVAYKAVDAAKQAANEEERSTAGDKYDTARAMSHINQDMFGKQLSEVLKLKQHLVQTSFESELNAVQSGAIVTTNTGVYFIAASVGAIVVEGKQIMVISPISPIAQQMLGKGVGEQVVFNGTIIIEEII